MFFYILHDLLPSMLLFIMGFGLVCLAALALFLAFKGCQKISVREAPVTARPSSAQPQLRPDANLIAEGYAERYAEGYARKTMAHHGGAPYAAH
jgi:hypothetical protein